MIPASCLAHRRAVLLEQVDLESGHGADCERCRAFAAASEEVRAAVASAAGRWAPSPALRARVRELAVAAPARPQGSRRWSRRALVGATAAAAVLAVVLAGAAASRLASKADEARREAAAMVADHLEYAARGSDKLQVASADPAVVGAFLAERLGFSPRLPTLSAATLAGGRRCSVAGRAVALAFYDARTLAGSRPISVFVLEGRGERWSALPPVPGAPSFRSYVDRGVTLLVRPEGALVYVVAGAEPPAELARRLSPAAR